jgi:hypothetical protein
MWTRDKTGGIESVFLADDIQKTSYWEGQEPRKPQRYGYPVHARCWSLVELLIGPEVEMYLETFVEALQRRFRKEILDPMYLLDQDNGVYIILEKSLPQLGLGPGSYEYDPEIREELLSDETRYLHRDPLQIPGLECLLKNAAIKKQTPDRDGGPLVQGPFDFIGLPLEIQYLVLDHLDLDEVATLHVAFTGRFELRVSDSYWKRRAPGKLIYEIQDFKDIEDNKSDTEVDWEKLCLRAEQFVQTSEHLKNRQRIMINLEGIRDLFYELIKET